MIVFLAGLLLTLGGVGGVETSVNSDELMGSCVIAILGLLAMYAGMLGLRGANYYDGR
jgi:hypothetical protein